MSPAAAPFSVLKKSEFFRCKMAHIDQSPMMHPGILSIMVFQVATDKNIRVRG